MLASVAEQIAAALHGVDRQGETVWDDSRPYPAPHPVFGRAQMTPAAAPSHGGLGVMVRSTGHPGLYMPYPGTVFRLLVVLQLLSLFGAGAGAVLVLVALRKFAIDVEAGTALEGKIS